MTAAAPQAAAAHAAIAGYSASDYWDTRYAGEAKHFDWFFNYPALKKLLQRYLPEAGKILHIGCGNSNIQEGMAQDGFSVTNVDISPVVIEQMKTMHAHMTSTLDYLVADCRDMSALPTASFGGCIDKGTLDAVLCGATGQRDAASYLQEIARLLQPGGVFLLISLGVPSARISLLEKLQLWSNVQVLLLPKPLLYLQPDVTLTGRALPAKCAANKDEPIEGVGPWPAAAAAAELAAHTDLDERNYFFAYICTTAQAEVGVVEVAEAAKAAEADAEAVGVVEAADAGAHICIAADVAKVEAEVGTVAGEAGDPNSTGTRPEAGPGTGPSEQAELEKQQERLKSTALDAALNVAVVGEEVAEAVADEGMEGEPA